MKIRGHYGSPPPTGKMAAAHDAMPLEAEFALASAPVAFTEEVAFRDTAEAPQPVSKPRDPIIVGVVRGMRRAMLGDDPDTVAGWVNFCTTAGFEAALAVVEGEREANHELDHDDDDEAQFESKAGRYAAAQAFMQCLPPITSRRRAQCYIGCVAAGMQYGYITGEKARAMLYAGQLAIAAFGKPTRAHEVKA